MRWMQSFLFTVTCDLHRGLIISSHRIRGPVGLVSGRRINDSPGHNTVICEYVGWLTIYSLSLSRCVLYTFERDTLYVSISVTFKTVSSTFILIIYKNSLDVDYFVNVVNSTMMTRVFSCWHQFKRRHFKNIVWAN